MDYTEPNFSNLKTKDEVVAELINELDLLIGNIHGDRIIGENGEYPVKYEADRAVAYYVASLIYRLTGDEKYNWIDNSDDIYKLDEELNKYREQRYAELEQR